MIYVKIFLSLCLIFAIGGSILSFFSKGNLRKIFLLAFPIGYIFLNMAYFELRKNELSSEKSVYSILVFTLVFLLLTIKYKFKIFAHIFLYTWQSFFSKKLIIPLVISLFLATWPYYAIGENFYNHSSNEDFYDGVIGGHQFATLDFKAIIPDFKGHIRYQYSAIGLFETLHQSEGINAYLHNSILNLILIIIGAYFLIHNIFGISNKTALICAFFCFNSTFYFHTYLAGHIGSMMYTSIAPFYVGSIILLTTSSSKMKWAALCTIMSYFLYATYIDAKLMVEGTAVVFILLKIALYFNFQNILYLKDKKINYKRLSILSVVTIFLLLGFVLFKWKDWELIRTYNFETSNSWRIASQKEMIAVFWGLFSPNLAGATSLNAFLADMISLKVTLYSLSFLLFVCYAFFIIKHYRNQKILYLTLYALLFPYLFFVVKYCWGSTYYSYKVLYVNYFLIVTIVILGVQALPIKNLFLKYLQYALFLFVAVLNIFWNLF